jgi:diguanylate cyclase (GGDEF)-like protein
MALAGIYSFVAVAAFFLFAPPLALAYLVTAITACTVVLSVRGVPAGPVVALAVVTATIALVVATLVRRASSASLDGLTGLANRRGFDDALDEAMRVTARSGAQFSVALVDVDHFKAINDQHGHAAGDDLLRSVARAWAPLVPRGALLARHGGDEFALLLPSCRGPVALRVVEGLRLACPKVPLSAGVAQHRPGELASQLMRRADTALYRAKADGRGRSVLHDDDQDGGRAPRGTAPPTGQG